MINSQPVMTNQLHKLWLNIALSFLGEFLSSRAHHNVQNISEVDASTNELTQSYSNNADSIQALITLRNKQQKILNLEKFGTLTQSTVLITVQVHNRFSYLAKLIESLKAARDISSALVIFSHDVFSQEANQMIQEIDFCMVMQIFYPYSIQTHPLTFPGDDPKDCPRDISRSEAERINCRNYDHPGMSPRGFRGNPPNWIYIGDEYKLMKSIQSQTCTVTTERRNLPKWSTIGGGSSIEFSINWGPQSTSTDICFYLKKIITLPKISFTCWNSCRRDLSKHVPTVAS